LLAHYAQVSTQSEVELPAPANLSVLFDTFVADATLRHDPLMMETAGAQCLLLAGLFEDQMRAPQHSLVCAARPRTAGSVLPAAAAPPAHVTVMQELNP